MRLIDADALMKIVQHEEIQAQVHGREFSTCFMSPGGTMSTEWWYVENLIEDAPTIEERKTGMWIKEYWNGEHTRKCSACNITQTVTTYRGKVNFKYCPYCGAKMKGVTE